MRTLIAAVSLIVLAPAALAQTAAPVPKPILGGASRPMLNPPLPPSGSAAVVNPVPVPAARAPVDTTALTPADQALSPGRTGAAEAGTGARRDGSRR
jgi:hypothetical protein